MTDHARVNTASTAYLAALFDHVRERGLAPAALGADPAQLDREGRLSEAECATLFDRASDLLGDPDLGLHVGEGIRPGHYGVLGYVSMNCRTLGEALDQLRRYQALVLDIGGPSVHLAGASCEFRWNPDIAEPLRQLAEFNLSALLTFTRWISGIADPPLGLGFTFDAPSRLDEHHRIFGSPLAFGEAVYSLRIPADWLQRPLIQPDPAMRRMMLGLAEQQMAALQRPAHALGRVREAIARQLGAGTPDLSAVAMALETSTRSLQRSLQAESLSFSQLVDSVRRELAERYLSDPGLNLTDVAFLLGYSEQSAFARAFKRWTGTSPGGYRAQRLSAAPEDSAPG